MEIPVVLLSKGEKNMTYTESVPFMFIVILFLSMSGGLLIASAMTSMSIKLAYLAAIFALVGFALLGICGLATGSDLLKVASVVALLFLSVTCFGLNYAKKKTAQHQ